MFKLFLNRLKLAKLQKARSQISKEYKAERKRLLSSGLSEEEAGNRASQMLKGDLRATRADVVVFQSDRLVEEAERLQVPIPQEEKFWIRLKYAAHLHLSEEGQALLRKRVREEKKARRETVGFSFNIFTVILSLLVAILAAWGSIFYARHAEVTQSRAYVNVTGLEIESVNDSAGKQIYWKVAPIIVNTGNTPTKNLWWTATFGDVHFDLSKTGPRIPQADNLVTATRNHASLAAHSENKHLIEQPIEAKYTEALRSQQIRVYIHGAVVYQDQFSTDVHITRYCYGLWGNPAVTGPSGLSYSACGGTSNCTDDECHERLTAGLFNELP